MRGFYILQEPCHSPSKMKTSLLVVVSLLAISVVTSLRAATPEQEKAFVDKYKTAFEAGDKATLESFLYTKNAHPMALEFYKMMQTNDAAEKSPVSN